MTYARWPSGPFFQCALAVFGGVLVTGCPAGTGGDPPPTIAVSGSVEDFLSGDPIAGVDICAPSHPDVVCVFSDPDGLYELAGVPANEPVHFLGSRDDYRWGSGFVLATGEEDLEVGRGALIDDTTAALQFGLFGVDAVDGTGIINIGTGNTIDGDGLGAAGITGELSPAAGDGPLYFDDDNQPTPDGTSSGAGGGVIFVNVPPGDYTVSLAGGDCEVDEEVPWGWPADGGGWSVLVVADAITFFGLECPE